MDISTDEREAKMEPGDHIHDNSGLEQKGDHSEPILRPSDVHLAEEKIENEKSDIQPTTLPQSLPRKKSAEHAIPGDEEAPGSDHARIERLGRERPAKFKSSVAEFTFCYSVIASLFMTEYFVSGFNVILPSLIKDLSIPQASVVWPASAFALVSAAFFLPFGRLADMYGGYPIYLFGLVWFTVWSIIGGFSQNDLMPGTSRAGPGCFPSVRCDVDGKHIQTRAPEEFCVQYLRRRRSFRIFPWYLRRRRDW